MKRRRVLIVGWLVLALSVATGITAGSTAVAAGDPVVMVAGTLPVRRAATAAPSARRPHRAAGAGHACPHGWRQPVQLRPVHRVPERLRQDLGPVQEQDLPHRR